MGKNMFQKGSQRWNRKTRKRTYTQVFLLIFVTMVVFIMLAQNEMLTVTLEKNESKREWKGFQNFYFDEDETKELNCTGFINGDNETIRNYVTAGRLKLHRKRLLDLSMDCESLKFRIHGDVEHFEQLERPIAYVRNIYRFYELQEAFLSTIYHPSNTYCYVMDSKSDAKMKYQMRQLSKCFENVFVMEEEYDFNSSGRGQERAHFDCLAKILNREWYHTMIMQNFDMVVKTNEQISNISRDLNWTSLIGLEDAYPYRYDTKADWTPAALKLFKDETDVPEVILNTKMTVRKSNSEVFVSKVFIESIFEKLNLERILNLIDDDKYYAVDEMLIPTLFFNYLGLDGQIESKCFSNKTDDISRATHWSFSGPDGYSERCYSKWKRHGICMMGVEYLNSLSNHLAIIANKPFSSFDFGTVICVREMVRTGKTCKVSPLSSFNDYPQYREMVEKMAGSYDKNNFKC